jgi:hypothetical protein
MKHTKLLEVLVDYKFKEGQMVIHPNAGFDLGLMSTSYPVEVYTNVNLDHFKSESGILGEISLKNECKKGTIEISKHNWKKMGEPEKVMLFYENKKLLMMSKKSTG